ncbi:MAG: 16S rRNA (guanine(966)-N(2))-methyltransferase RsmD [candidate division FCPU426 bacterium]
MRIIAGDFHGRRLKSPAGNRTRPTLSRVREALFNILAPHLLSARFLDLYAGAGTIGLEALSRGCSRAVFVEGDAHICRVLRDNVERLDPKGERAEVIQGDAVAVARRLGQRSERFHIIFLDPPYHRSETERWTMEKSLAGLLAPNGIAVLQHDRKWAAPEAWAGCRKYRSRDYGSTTLSFFQADPTGPRAGGEQS